MSKFKKLISQQIENNILAILSLIIAISALGYNSWRNELSEQNRNVRYAGFEIIKESAKLQQFIDQSTFVTKVSKSNTPIEGWVRVRLINSLSIFMNSRVQLSAEKLFNIWKQQWQALKSDEQANVEISKVIDVLIAEVNIELSNLK